MPLPVRTISAGMAVLYLYYSLTVCRSHWAVTVPVALPLRVLVTAHWH